MKRTGAQILMASAFLSVRALYAQDRQKPAYLNFDLLAPQRAEPRPPHDG
jgi:hypothetical protein